jgi:hypothetical protein
VRSPWSTLPALRSPSSVHARPIPPALRPRPRCRCSPTAAILLPAAFTQVVAVESCARSHVPLFAVAGSLLAPRFSSSMVCARRRVREFSLLGLNFHRVVDLAGCRRSSSCRVCSSIYVTLPYRRQAVEPRSSLPNLVEPRIPRDLCASLIKCSVEDFNRRLSSFRASLRNPKNRVKTKLTA